MSYLIWIYAVRILRIEFHFSDVYQSVNYTGLHAKWMNPDGVHVNFVCDLM